MLELEYDPCGVELVLQALSIITLFFPIVPGGLGIASYLLGVKTLRLLPQSVTTLQISLKIRPEPIA